jgi:hydrogenobyrinic acid a,c-diamide cobaltochelatase (EC 6.6.1.2)
MLSQEEQKRLARIIQAGKDLLSKLLTNQAELHSLLNGLNGGYVAPQFGGDVIRDGARVLPTGRNIHAMDPWRVPSELAMQRGQQIAQKLLAAHCNSASKFPETVAQVLWGMDTIKTKGEPIAIVLALIGARPEKDAHGKISAYKLIPLSELGRPRIDVLMMASGIFRDTFAMQIDFLDRLVKDAAQADEAPEMNFIKKHVEEIIAEKHVSFEDATARIFTQRPGDYGNYVDDMIESSSWQDENELGEMFFKRNAYAYGGTKKGKLCAAVLDSLLTKVEHISQELIQWSTVLPTINTTLQSLAPCVRQWLSAQASKSKSATLSLSPLRPRYAVWNLLCVWKLAPNCSIRSGMRPCSSIKPAVLPKSLVASPTFWAGQPQQKLSINGSSMNLPKLTFLMNRCATA